MSRFIDLLDNPMLLTEKGMDGLAEFLLDILHENGGEEEKAKVNVMRSYKKVSDNLERVVEYGFVNNNTPTEDCKAAVELLESINKSVEDYCKLHNVPARK